MFLDKNLKVVKKLKCGCRFDRDPTGYGLKLCEKHRRKYKETYKYEPLPSGLTYIDHFINEVLKENEVNV